MSVMTEIHQERTMDTCVYTTTKVLATRPVAANERAQLNETQLSGIHRASNTLMKVDPPSEK